MMLVVSINCRHEVLNNVLTIKPKYNYYVVVHERVDKIGHIEPQTEYSVLTLDIPKAFGLKLNKLNLQPMVNLSRVNFWNYKGDPQIVDLNMFRDLKLMYHINLYNENIIEIENTAKMCILENLETLDLSYNKLTTFNLSYISCFSKLKKLELNHNKIFTLSNSPDSASCHWPNLEIIRLSSNKLKQFETLFFNCSAQLSKLWLGSNQLTTFGRGANCSWPNLASLWINNNKLEYFNESFLNCSINLQDLRLSKNKLTNFGPICRPILINETWIGGMSKIQILDLSSNHLTNIDFQQFTFAKGLQVVLLANNRLATVDINLRNSSYPAMFKFHINANRWTCDELKKMINGIENMTFGYEFGCRKSVRGICCYD